MAEVKATEEKYNEWMDTLPLFFNQLFPQSNLILGQSLALSGQRKQWKT
jgi:hypothetical protein